MAASSSGKFMSETVSLIAVLVKRSNVSSYGNFSRLGRPDRSQNTRDFKVGQVVVNRLPIDPRYIIVVRLVKRVISDLINNAFRHVNHYTLDLIG